MLSISSRVSSLHSDSGRGGIRGSVRCISLSPLLSRNLTLLGLSICTNEADCQRLLIFSLGARIRYGELARQRAPTCRSGKPNYYVFNRDLHSSLFYLAVRKRFPTGSIIIQPSRTKLLE